MIELEWIDEPHIALVPGFRAAGVACGIKAEGALDLTVISSETSCSAGAVFTRNQVQAAPVLYDRRLLASSTAFRAVLINSGCANACTGERGLSDAKEMTVAVESALNLESNTTFVMSTGVIGQHLPMEKIRDGIVQASRIMGEDNACGHNAAKAIMTTDTRPKEVAIRFRVGDQSVTIAGMCKGSGMIHPNMATMLALFTTDAAIEPKALQHALNYAVERSFNSVTVDGDTSTNDTVLILANGLAGHQIISDVNTPAYLAFREGLTQAAIALAIEIARDGEGATKFVTVQITGARTFESARVVAKSIATSTLVKTAIYGQDANWGRILCAAGYSETEIDQDRLALYMSDHTDTLQLVRDGAPFKVDENRAAAILASTDVTLHLDLGLGDAQATVWTCDLSHEYVDINAHYRT